MAEKSDIVPDWRAVDCPVCGVPAHALCLFDGRPDAEPHQLRRLAAVKGGHLVPVEKLLRPEKPEKKHRQLDLFSDISEEESQ